MKKIFARFLVSLLRKMSVAIVIGCDISPNGVVMDNKNKLCFFTDNIIRGFEKYNGVTINENKIIILSRGDENEKQI